MAPTMGKAPPWTCSESDDVGGVQAEGLHRRSRLFPTGIRENVLRVEGIVPSYRLPPYRGRLRIRPAACPGHEWERTTDGQAWQIRFSGTSCTAPVRAWKPPFFGGNPTVGNVLEISPVCAGHVGGKSLNSPHADTSTISVSSVAAVKSPVPSYAQTDR